ncbi:MAG: hypothetical protein ACXQTG_06680 [Methanoculleaceae archaeon]
MRESCDPGWAAALLTPSFRGVPTAALAASGDRMCAAAVGTRPVRPVVPPAPDIFCMADATNRNFLLLSTTMGDITIDLNGDMPLTVGNS